MTASGPYRDAPRVARYICVVCYRWASTSPGVCGTCSAPLHDIARPEVLRMMHDEANRRLLRSAELQATAEPRWFDSILSQLLSLVEALVYRLLKKPRPVSARATLAARRARENAAGGDPVPILLDHPELAGMTPGRFEVAGEDPDLLDAQGLVRWLGATLRD